MRDKPPADRYHQIARAKRVTLAAARAKADPANAAPIIDSAANELDELCRGTLLPDSKEHAASAAAELARAIVATASSAKADQLAAARARAPRRSSRRPLTRSRPRARPAAPPG
jgi:hypothetical protein